MRFSEFYFYAHRFPPATQDQQNRQEKEKCWVLVTERLMRAMPPHVGAKYYKNIF